MGEPRDKDARLFYRAAKQRLADAVFLLGAERTTAATYLGGYCVECVLKALLLSRCPRGKKEDILNSFRRAGGHDFDRLRYVLSTYDQAPFPRPVVEAFVIARVWATDLRYEVGSRPGDDTEEFLAAVETIFGWADGRL